MVDGKNGPKDEASSPPKRSRGRKAKNSKATIHDISNEGSDMEGDSNLNGSP